LPQFSLAISPHIPQVPEPQGRDWEKEVSPITEDDEVQDLRNLNVHRSMRLNQKHPRILREVTDVAAKPLSIIFVKSWQSDKVPSGWTKANIAPIFKKSKRRTLGTTDQSASPQGPVRSWNRSSWKIC